MMRRFAIAACAALSFPAVAGAQVIAPSARGAGMADAYGAVARGAMAGLYNPAMLGLRDNPGFSLNLPTASAQVGAGPIGFSDYREWQGRVVPDDVKQDWLARIPAGGTLDLSALAAVSGLGVQVGPVALNVAGVAEGLVGLPRGAVDLFLFGNVGPGGEPRDIAFTSGRAFGYGATVVSASTGFPVWTAGRGLAQQRLAVGVTAKAVIGHGLADMIALNGAVTANPIEGSFTFPTALVYRDGQAYASTAFGADVGVAYQAGGLTLGLAVTDAVNGLAWDRSDVRVIDGRLFFGADSTSDFTDEVPLDDPSVSPALRQQVLDRVDAARFKPALRASFAYRLGGRLLLTSDLVQRTATAANLQGSVRTMLSGGVEFRLLSFLPLRGGAGVMDGGTVFTVGTGLEFGLVNLTAAYGRRQGDLGEGERVSVGLSIGRGY